MERTSQEPYEELSFQSTDVGIDTDAPQSEAVAMSESWDERVIREGIDAAVSEGRPIDDRTARYIASQLHGGQDSPLYALASSGAVRPDVFSELDHDRVHQPDTVRRWIACLTLYCAARTDTGPVEGWAEQGEASDRLDLMRRISAAGVTTLGQVATIHGPDETDAASGEADHDGETDMFPWSDAATWTAGVDEETAAEARVRFDLSEDEFDALFAGEADEEVGDMAELGWYGMVRWTDRVGGLVLKVDSDGNRHTWLMDTTDALDARWAAIQEEYEQYEAYGVATAPSGPTHSGLHPRVWVGSLADYNEGRLHGAWFDALLEPEQLELAAKFMLRLGQVRGAEEWGIFDYDEFYGVELGEYEPFGKITKIAQGLAKHGEAFGHWAEYVGSDSERLDRFEDHYRGEWDSLEAYLSDYLEETGFYRFLENVPEEMRGYIEVDVEQIARDWSSDYHEITLQNGRAGVFDTHA